MAPEKSSSTGPLAGMAILLVEDVWHLADAQAFALETAGAKVVGVASTLAAAERMAETLTFDAAIMDLNLHGEFTHDLLVRLGAKRVKVIIISGYTATPELAAKAHACLGKSASSDAIIAALKTPLRD